MRFVVYVLLILILLCCGALAFKIYENTVQNQEFNQTQEIIQQQNLLDLDASALE